MEGYLLVAAGGAVGASLRYGATLLFARPDTGAFPWHTLGVNVLGAFALGLLMGALPESAAAERWRLFLGVGILGGFTTFSAFSLEALSLAQSGSWWASSGYVLGSVAAGLAGVTVGHAIGRALG
jgi:CrcB protein